MARRWCLVMCLALVVLQLVVPQLTDAEEQRTEREKVIDRATPWVGSVAALVASAAFIGSAGWYASGQDRLFTEAATDGQKLLVAIPATATFTVTSWFITRCFERTVLARSKSVWGAALWGAGVGALAGAAIAVPGWTVILGTGTPMGIITTGDMSYLAVLGMSVVSGAFWGALSGVLPGMVLGPALYLMANR